MQAKSLGMAAALVAALTVSGHGQVTQKPKPFKVMFVTHTGEPAGEAKISEAKDGGVKIKLSIKNIPFGEHGVHIHENADCTGPDFKTAGGHFNPTMKHHGFANPAGHHAGDTPQNLSIGENHMGEATFVLTDLTMDPLAPNSIFAHGGTSIVIHEHADDEKTDPSGNSGNRIACAVIKQP
jgi:Cu-Zn family superoxide dismutase